MGKMFYIMHANIIAVQAKVLTTSAMMLQNATEVMENVALAIQRMTS